MLLRVNCVIIFLFINSIFGHEDSAADDIIFVNWLNMVRAGLVGLEYYSPQTKKWGQVCALYMYVVTMYIHVLVCVHVCVRT